MFCYQCQETAKNSGCTVRGVCGKTEETANLQDLLIYILRGISIYARDIKKDRQLDSSVGLFIVRSLFTTITNANFDDERIISLIKEGLSLREKLKKKSGLQNTGNFHDSAFWYSDNVEDFKSKAAEVGVLSTADEDIRSLRELLVYGLKGISAYADHAALLGFGDKEIFNFIIDALASTTEDLSVEEMTGMVIKAGETAVKTMALLDKANTSAYGNPEITKVNIGAGKNPGILDAGQCNDSYSLVVIALKLKDAFGFDDINELPVVYDLAWYEQKAVAVLLALLSLGVRGIRLGPTLPAFLSPEVIKVLAEKFDIKQITSGKQDIESIMSEG